MMTPEIKAVLADPGVSDWLKRALLDNMSRDLVDAGRDAELLLRLLNERYALVMAKVHLSIIARPLPNLTCHTCRKQVPAGWTKPCPNCGADRERIWL